MEEKVFDVAMESTSQEILNKVVNGVTVNGTVTAGFRKPIKIQGTDFSSSGGTFTGTGKGKIIFMIRSSKGVEITIDGVNLGTSDGDTNTPTYGEVEFTTSFSLKFNTYGSACATFY